MPPAGVLNRLRVPANFGASPAAAREVSIDAQESVETIEQQLRESLAQPNAILTLTDAKGRKVLIPARGIAYLDLGQPNSRQVGFGTL